jgi:hypothetical protein
MSDTSSYGYGQLQPEDFNHEMAVVAAIARQMIAELDTIKLVQVAAVHGGGVALAGTVDVVPLVNQVDGQFNPVPHGTVYGVPWTRVQGGPNAIICDPQVNDIGWVACCDRDISKAVAQNGMLSGSSLLGTGVNPGSWRKYNICDGIYVGGALNVSPTQYLQFTATGARLVDKNGNSVALGPNGITLTDANGNVISTTSAGIAVTLASGGDFVINGIGFLAHIHSGVTAGSADTGPPVP